MVLPRGLPKKEITVKSHACDKNSLDQKSIFWTPRVTFFGRHSEKHVCYKIHANKKVFFVYSPEVTFFGNHASKVRWLNQRVEFPFMGIGTFYRGTFFLKKNVRSNDDDGKKNTF